MIHRTWNTKDDFDELYDIGLGIWENGKEVRGQYERSTMFNENDSRLNLVHKNWSKLINEYNWPLESRILILGCGFGWSIEYLMKKGYTNLVGVDNSKYIQSSKSKVDPRTNLPNSKVPDKIVDLDITKAEDMESLGKKFDVVVAEYVLSSYSSSMITKIIEDIEKYTLKSNGYLIILDIK